MKDPTYQLKKEDIVSEIKGGYVIKVKGTYYVYLKDAKHADNVRTKEEIKRQKQEHGHGGEIRSVMRLRRLENKDGIRQMMAIFSIRQISSKIQVMPISYRMATTSTIFQKRFITK